MSIKDYTKTIDAATKLGVHHPLLSQATPEESKLDKQIGNYQKRISAIDEPVPQQQNKHNIFLKALSYLDRPRAALWNGAQDTITGENSFAQGAWEGLTGKENYTGKQLLQDLGVENKTAQGLLGFGAEVVADPLNLVTFGAGSAAKGAITGTSKVLGREGAEALAKAATKEVTNAATHTAAKEAAQKVAEKYGITLPSSITPEALSASVADKLLETEAKTAGRGISIGTRNHNISLVSDNKMRELGAKASNFVKEKVPVLGNVVEGIQDFGKKIFDPTYITGLDDTTANAIYTFRRAAYGEKNVADASTMRQFDEYGKQLGELGVKSAKEQDQLIAKVIEGTADLEQLHPAVQNLVTKFADDFKAWGTKEKDLGLLSSLFGDEYFPHVPNWSNSDKVTRRAGVTEKIKFTNPSGWQRSAGKTIEGANNFMRYKTSSVPQQEAFVNAVYDLAGKNFNGNNLPSPSQVGEFISTNALFDKVKPLYEMLDGTPDFFETSAVKAWMTRALEHNKIIADKEFVDNTIAAFGNKINNRQTMQQAIDDGKDIIIPKSSLQLFRINTKDAIGINSAMKQAGEETLNTAGATVERIGGDLNALVKRLMSETPEAFAKVKPEELELLQNSLPELAAGGVFGKTNIIEAYAVPQGVINAITQGSRKQVNAGFEALGNVIDKFYAFWKPSVTGLNPSYHIRNLVGSSLNNALDIGIKVFDPVLQKDSLKLTYGGADGIIELAGNKIPIQELRDAMLRGHANTNLQIGEFVSQKASMQNRYAQNIGEGAGGIVGAVKGAVQSIKDKPTRAIAKVGETAGKQVENVVRGTNFLANVEHGLEQGMTKEAAYKFASEQVNKFHFDYSEITKTESEIFRRIFPFYTWVRKNLPLQLEQFLNNPSFYTAIPKYQRSMQDAYGVDASQMPEWFQGQLPLPMPDGGKDANGRQTYVNLSAPQADIGNILGDPLKYATGALSPLIKVPLETAANRSMLTGAPLYANKYEKNQKVFENIVNQFGAVRNAKNALSEAPDESGKAVASGKDMFKITKEYSPEEAATDAKYAYNRQLGNEVQYLNDKFHDIVPNTIDTEKWNQLPADVIEAIKRTGVVPTYLKKTETITIPKDDTPNYSTGYRARYINKITNSSKQVTFEKAVKNILYKNGGL